MGFLESFKTTIRKRDNAVDVYNEYESKNNDYRRIGLENTPSNYGWYKCVKCGKSFRKGDMDIDHILPKSKGGGNERENLQCICKHCNRSKQADTSETMSDLARRKKELKKQDKADKEYIAQMTKEYRKEQQKRK